MKRIRIVLLCALATVIGLIGTSSIPAAAQSNLNDFYIQDFVADYYLSKDQDQRSVLKTSEVITAVFPEFDQNRGILRAIPTTFDGRSTNLSIESVEYSPGEAAPYSTYDDNNNLVLRIGDPDNYVRGTKKYYITYTQRDVTKYFADTQSDEFYWDTNGLEWPVPINRVLARVHIDPSLTGNLSGATACYQGAAGSNEPCQITETDDGFEMQANDLDAYENLTFSIGFAPNTFAAYKMPLAEQLFLWWLAYAAITLPIGIIMLIWLLSKIKKQSDRTNEIDPIAPEYLPPKDASVSTSAILSAKYGTTFGAQLIDLAVRHYLKIYQTREQSWFRTANYELEIIKDINSLKAEEQEVLQDIFDDPVVGAKLDLASLRRNRGVGTRLMDNAGKNKKDISGSYGFRAVIPELSDYYRGLAKTYSLLGVLILSPWLLILAIIAVATAYTIKPLTDTGLSLVRYLKGLEMYIKVAETERLNMLQSPEGAAKLHQPIDTNDSRQLIKLYERVLPYAVLFGLEKNWNKQLGQYYQTANETPSWYIGTQGAFHAASFESAISSFSKAATYSNPSNSSSGGSSGGGGSGGGGGGGGGGGW